MSDITKKIHSIEPETNLPEGRIKLKPLPEAPVERDVPDFVKRRNDLNPTLYKPSNTGQVFLWAGVLFADFVLGDNAQTLKSNQRRRPSIIRYIGTITQGG